MIFALTIALSYVLTNIDGLFAFFAIAVSGRHRQAVTGFLAAQILVTGGAYATGAGVNFFSPHVIGYLGVVPLGLGLWELRKTYRNRQTTAIPAGEGHSVLSSMILFLALSTDTFVLMAAFFADSTPGYDRFILAGALIAVTTLLLAGTLLAASLKDNKTVQRFFERLSPFVMILAGIYILLDTATDQL